MRGLRRPQKPAQVTGLTCEVIAKIEATACAPRKGRGRGHVDIAPVRTMRDGLLRRSEAATLQWQDLSTEADGSGRLHIAPSKTDQEERGHVAYLTPDTAACLERIKPADARPEDRIIPMSARTIANRPGQRHGRALRRPLRARRYGGIFLCLFKLKRGEAPQNRLTGMYGAGCRALRASESLQMVSDRIFTRLAAILATSLANNLARGTPMRARFHTRPR